MLFNGERIGDGTPPRPTSPSTRSTARLTALGRAGALAVIAVSERGTMFDPGPCVYMEKLAVGPDAAHTIDIASSPVDNLVAVAKAKGVSVHDLTVVVLDRERHHELIDVVPRDGRQDHAHHRRRRRRGDRDRMAGVGCRRADRDRGTPEGVIAAAALKCMGGEIQCRLWPRDDAERSAALEAGYDLEKVLRQ